MTDVRELIQDLRAHAPEAPDHCARLMRDASQLLDRYKNLIGVALLDEQRSAEPPPIPPPPLGGKHRHPAKAG
jgi:hypothetical protein